MDAEIAGICIFSALESAFILTSDIQLLNFKGIANFFYTTTLVQQINSEINWFCLLK